MAANKVREKVTPSSDVMRCRADVMGVQEAPAWGRLFVRCLGVSRVDSSAPRRWDLHSPYPGADVMGLSSAVKVRWRTPEKVRCRTPRIPEKVRWLYPRADVIALYPREGEMPYRPYPREGETVVPPSWRDRAVPPRRWDAVPPSWRDGCGWLVPWGCTEWFSLFFFAPPKCRVEEP